MSSKTFEWKGFVGSDNLPNRSGLRTPATELKALASLMVGCPATLDHGVYRGVAGNFGRIVDAELLTIPTPSNLSKLDMDALTADGGYMQLITGVAIETGHPQLEELASLRQSECSLSFMYTALRCPGCTCGKDLWSCESRVNPPYFERWGVVDGLEISLVVSAAVKRAKLVPIK